MKRIIFPLRKNILGCFYSSVSETYQAAFRRSLENPSQFWEEQAQRLIWFKRWEKVLTDSGSPHARWFKGGFTNICYNCLDRQVIMNQGEKVALVYDSPMIGFRQHYKYGELLETVSHLSGYLARQCSVKKGDRILIYMPSIPECIIAMLAAARLGAIHAVVFGGFSAEKLAIRINSVKPKVIITASYGIEKTRQTDYKSVVDQAFQISACKDQVKRCIVFQRPVLPPVSLEPQSFYVNWMEALYSSRPHDAVPVESNDPLYILHTSGTTGDPKGVVRDHGGYQVALNYCSEMVYGMQSGKVWWATSEFGWVVGHSFACYGPLLRGAPTVIYEGKAVGTPDAAQLFRVASQNNVHGWLLNPSALRAIRSEDPELKQSEDYRSRLNKLRNVFLAGERCDISTIAWLAKRLPTNVRISDSWWQTETGWPISSSCLGYEGGYFQDIGVTVPVGSVGLPVPGYDVQLAKAEERGETSRCTKVNENGKEISLKRILIKLPLPPGTTKTLWEDEKQFMDAYFERYPGYYDTMDLGYVDEHGCLHVMGRADNVIDISGKKLCIVALEDACLAVNDIVDCAAIAVPHETKGHVPLGLLVKNPESKKTNEEVIKAFIHSVRKLVGPVASYTKACVVPKLPRTLTGKISRASLTQMAAGKAVHVPMAIEDASVYKRIHEIFESCGLKPSSSSST
ncbi:unnamed protein product [Calicophoron daubneyi]|uniref:Acyl-CoA synthetase short-chain family member 3, mitochondrial n=1 Tax=Calicophoron daubneyi TaxID=300641 RepID=A0AAV2T4A2_CALDB